MSENDRSLFHNITLETEQNSLEMSKHMHGYYKLTRCFVAQGKLDYDVELTTSSLCVRAL